MKFGLLALAISFCFPLAAYADRVGNGGGVWACALPNGVYQSAALVDLFEARSEFQLFVPDPALVQTPNEIYQARKTWIQQNLSGFSAGMAPYFARVEANLLMVSAQLQVVDDADFRVMPLATECLTGRWDYLQFANYTDYDRVLVRKDIWDAAYLPNLDKAALLIHEAVYLMLRERDHDTNSIRAREITGLLFSNLPVTEIALRINTILGQTSPVPPPVAAPAPSPSGQWVCAGTNTATSESFIGKGSVEIEAQYEFSHACETAEPNYRAYCKMSDCAPIQSVSPNVACVSRNSSTSRSYIGKGRNLVEAKAEAMISCTATEVNYRAYCAIDKCSN